MARIVGSELIEDARQRGRIVFEILPGDIVTDVARETAERIGLRLVEGPLEKPQSVRSDGNTAMRRQLYKRSARWVAPRSAPAMKASRFAKIALIGAGGVGGNVAHLAALADMADEIILIDIAPGLAAATALDLNHMSGITGARTRCTGAEDLSMVAGADVVVVTAGRARAPGMTRADLINTNARVIRSAAEAITSSAPNAVVIVITNPLDEMTFEMLRATQFPRERVLGMAGTLDSSRFRHALAKAAGVTPADVSAITLGSHGEEMAPITSLARIKGRRLERFLTDDQIEACVKDAVTGGGQVVALKKSGSATIAPAHSTIELLNHMRGATSGSVPVSVLLEGEYGISGVVVGVPAHLGRSGLIEVEKLRLSQDETQALHAAADAIRNRLGLST
ncbi:MAG: malate dehydrogenase [Ahrensia sp.]|nr:malate dehydrogenase [Ahrensia sp.]